MPRHYPLSESMTRTWMDVEEAVHPETSFDERQNRDRFRTPDGRDYTDDPMYDVNKFNFLFSKEYPHRAKPKRIAEIRQHTADAIQFLEPP